MYATTNHVKSLLITYVYKGKILKPVLVCTSTVPPIVLTMIGKYLLLMVNQNLAS